MTKFDSLAVKFLTYLIVILYLLYGVSFLTSIFFVGYSASLDFSMVLFSFWMFFAAYRVVFFGFFEKVSFYILTNIMLIGIITLPFIFLFFYLPLDCVMAVLLKKKSLIQIFICMPVLVWTIIIWGKL